MAFLIKLPPVTRASLLAKATVLLASKAAKVGLKPLMPNMATKTMSALG
ncbi:MAG: hypothetical protein KIIPBIDF_00752 [Candidatus Methanoperedenaceae archaeon GB50]|nr:MAG: hypothetical protein KIIPBIDF_00752 [Candidatus Methanoperedenaceae archaeon GB50]